MISYRILNFHPPHHRRPHTHTRTHMHQRTLTRTYTHMQKCILFLFLFLTYTQGSTYVPSNTQTSTLTHDLTHININRRKLFRLLFLTLSYIFSIFITDNLPKAFQCSIFNENSLKEEFNLCLIKQ